ASVDDHGTVSRADDTISDDSLRGPSDGSIQKPDLAAPGVLVRAPQFDTTGGYVELSGTSVAAAHVAGCAAIVQNLQFWGQPNSIRWLLTENSEDRGPLGWDPAWGFGMLDCFQAVDTLNDSLQSDFRFDGACGGTGQPPCWEHPGLYAQNPRIVE